MNKYWVKSLIILPAFILLAKFLIINNEIGEGGALNKCQQLVS
ncbi:hypothetical protein SPACI_004500 [Sporomusa acidovorans DSM 3132]|uniref:Uncharacterized protein n=1 Tax=Sporomusa acidovorans (strain ATCC 49682 / DSM 3132 / Mol) TaxID=1123286 RepID=A0ABZ3IXN4_SPOA4|nr:hypothetical protein SAMN04488499_10765 [Sporomusa acidovorans]